MKNSTEPQSLQLEDFKIVEFQSSLCSIKGGTGWVCQLKPPTGKPTSPDEDTIDG